MREVHAFSATCVNERAVDAETPIALDDPGFRRGRTVLKEVFPPVGLAQLLDNAPIDRVPDPEQTVEVGSSEQVVEFLVGEPSHTAGTER